MSCGEGLKTEFVLGAFEKYPQELQVSVHNIRVPTPSYWKEIVFWKDIKYNIRHLALVINHLDEEGGAEVSCDTKLEVNAALDEIEQIAKDLQALVVEMRNYKSLEKTQATWDEIKKKVKRLNWVIAHVDDAAIRRHCERA